MGVSKNDEQSLYKNSFQYGDELKLVTNKMPNSIRLVNYIADVMDPANKVYLSRAVAISEMKIGASAYNRLRNYLLQQNVIAELKTRGFYMVNPKMIYKSRLSYKIGLINKYKDKALEYRKRKNHRQIRERSH